MIRGFLTGFMVLAGLVPAHAADPEVAACLDRLATAEQRVCLDSLLRSANTELVATFGQVVQAARQADAQALASNSVRHQPLATAISRSQEAWQAYRDAECDGVAGRAGGSGAAVWRAGCLAEKTRARIRELQNPFDRR